MSQKTIYCVVFDGEHCIEHTEATLDTWWTSLSPERKAEIYEADLEGTLSEPVRELLPFTPTRSPYGTTLQQLMRIEDEFNAQRTEDPDATL